MSQTHTDFCIAELLRDTADLIGKDVNHKHDKGRIQSSLQKISSSLSKLECSYFPTVEFNENEGELSSNLHTCLRKYGNDSVEFALWQMISHDRGMNYWRAFIRGLIFLKSIKKGNKSQLTNRISLEVMTPDDFIIRGLIYGWDDDSFIGSINLIKEWSEEK